MPGRDRRGNDLTTGMKQSLVTHPSNGDAVGIKEFNDIRDRQCFIKRIENQDFISQFVTRKQTAGVRGDFSVTWNRDANRRLR